MSKNTAKKDRFGDPEVNNLLGGLNLSPQQIAVVTAILINALEVEYVLLDRNQTFQVLLEGSLKKKTEKDKLVEQVSGMSVGDLFDTLLKNQ